MSWDRRAVLVTIMWMLLIGFGGCALGQQSLVFRDLELACHRQGGTPGYAGFKAEENFYCKGVGK